MKEYKVVKADIYAHTATDGVVNINMGYDNRKGIEYVTNYFAKNGWVLREVSIYSTEFYLFFEK